MTYISKKFDISHCCYNGIIMNIMNIYFSDKQNISGNTCVKLVLAMDKLMLKVVLLFIKDEQI